MSYLFFDDFKSCDERGRACGWTILRNSDLAHEHRDWNPGEYIITATGNRHLPNVPELSAFTLATAFAVNDNIADHPEFRVYFHYDGLRGSGRFVSCRLEKGQCVAALGTESANAAAQIIETQSAPFAAERRVSPWNLSVKVADGRAELRFEDCPPFAFRLPECGAGKGRIAIDRGDFHGSLKLGFLKISSEEIVPATELLPETEIIFPADLNGFHAPLRYKVRITRLGATARLDLELSGSDTTWPDVPWFPYHGLMIDVLTAPYVRLGEQRLYPAGRETLILAKPHPVNQKFFYEELYRKPEWPLRASFYLAEVPAINTIGIGYEHCVIAANGNHLAGGPNEAIFDFARGKIVYAGAATRKGRFTLELHSPPDKEVCRRIPGTDPRHAAALAFARRNHFFIEPEQCRFKAVIRFAGDEFAPADISLDCRLENAFTEELKALTASPFKVVNNAELNFTEFVAELPAQTLPPGVYHLCFVLGFAGRSVITQRHAFEVMSADPDAPAAPLLSGLPLLFCMANETKGLEQDMFEPYLDVENNAAHYLSIATHAPDVGRRHRIYDILKIYHRKWFLWVTSRVAEHPGIEANRDVVSKCDFLKEPYLYSAGGGWAAEMWKKSTYSGSVLQALIGFLHSNDFCAGAEKHLTIANLEKLAAEKGVIPEQAIEELVTIHWHKWLNYFEKWLCSKELLLQNSLKKINPRIKRSSYGPIQAYVEHGKTNQVLKYRGTISMFLDGFFVFEDYPLTCKYNLQRGPILLAALKMAAPDTRIYPEIYTDVGIHKGQGCPDGAVAYAWPPFGVPRHPACAEKKRYFEYAYASAWFDKGKFSYWQDYGFHAGAFERRHFDVIIESWKFIHNAPPAKPLRCAAYVYSDAVCENHPAFYEYARPNCPAWGDIFNTAEETIPYVWETARGDGQLSGFLCALEALHQLPAKDAGLLVLPPLCGVTPEQRDAIRALHAQGVNLLAFEIVDGLEDLFGVELMPEAVAVHNIKVNGDLPGNPLAKLGSLKEYTEHPLSKAKYRATSASVLLTGEAPALMINQTASGKAALFNIPPTVVRRDSFYERVAYGRGSISELINRSVAIMHRELGSPAVTTTAGKLIAFEAQNGDRHIIIEEDAFPDDPSPIAPLVTINLPNLKASRISCDKPFAVHTEAERTSLRVHLAEHECAIVTIANSP